MNFANVVITETGRGYEIQFEYRPTIVKELKEMAGFRFQGKERGWYIPFSGKKKMPDGTIIDDFSNRNLMEKFKKKYLTVSAGSDEPEKFFKINELPELKIKLPWKPNMAPYHYQDKGIARGLELKRFINADEPGTGKTIQSIGTALAFEQSGINPWPCLIICPATLKENWRREIEEKFTNKRAVILSDKTRANWPGLVRMGMGHFVIVNYESLWSFFVVSAATKNNAKPKLADIKFTPLIGLFKSMIVDEAHKLRNDGTAQSMVAKGISIGKEIIMLLTGTPIVNKPNDLIPLLSIMGRLPEFGGFKYYLDRYCAGGSGAGNLNELNGKLNNSCFFRREKKDVLQDLPDKMREIFTCDITTRAEYAAAKGDLGKFLREQGYSEKQVDKSLNAEIMVKIGVLKAISARGKLPEAIEHIQEVVDAGQKIVVFIHQKFMAESLLKAFPGAVCIRGTDIDPVTGKEKTQSLSARQAAKDAFQGCNKCKVNQENHNHITDHEY
jgi:SWI/SNF-related matrix-associated actin-dependent regulator 1 of chromatin subfamily A